MNSCVVAVAVVDAKNQRLNEYSSPFYSPTTATIAVMPHTTDDQIEASHGGFINSGI